MRSSSGICEAGFFARATRSWPSPFQFVEDDTGLGGVGFVFGDEGGGVSCRALFSWNVPVGLGELSTLGATDEDECVFLSRRKKVRKAAATTSARRNVSIVGYEADSR